MVEEKMLKKSIENKSSMQFVWNKSLREVLKNKKGLKVVYNVADRKKK